MGRRLSERCPPLVRWKRGRGREGGREGAAAALATGGYVLLSVSSTHTRCGGSRGAPGGQYVAHSPVAGGGECSLRAASEQVCCVEHVWQSPLQMCAQYMSVHEQSMPCSVCIMQHYCRGCMPEKVCSLAGLIIHVSTLPGSLLPPSSLSLLPSSLSLSIFLSHSLWSTVDTIQQLISDPNAVSALSQKIAEFINTAKQPE